MSGCRCAGFSNLAGWIDSPAAGKIATDRLLKVSALEDSSLFKVARFIKRLLVYQPPSEPSRFVLNEGADDAHAACPSAKRLLKGDSAELAALIRFARRLTETMAKVQTALAKGRWAAEREVLRAEYVALAKQWAEIGPVILAYDAGAGNEAERPVSTSLAENEEIIKTLYNLPANKDIVLRHLAVATTPYRQAMLAYMEGLVNSQTISLAILQPLMLLAGGERRIDCEAMAKAVMEQLLPTNHARLVTGFRDIQAGINSGDTVIFLDGDAEAILVETKGWEHRSVSRPLTEQSIRGAQVAFTENLRVNTGLVRTMLRATDLVTELIPVGERSRVSCAIMYLSSVANPQLVAEIKRRVEGIDTDYINDSGYLEQFIEDRYILPLPQALSTERPDRVAAHLVEGRVALIVEGSPFALVAPANFFTFFHSGEDFSLQPSAANFLRVLRLFGTLLSVVLPALYVSLIYFHQEAIPTELALATAGAREEVPFPAWFEIMVMEISFELIREAGVRIPGVLGSTIGIVGAIILGQAAVAARIVSPITVILVAITGLASSIIPEYRMAFFARLSRFALMLMAVVMGLVGLAGGLLTLVVALCAMKSFGVPYMVPIAPRTIPGLDVVTRGPVWRRDRRPDPLSPLDPGRQAAPSRAWERKLPTGEERR
jgi:spore germination protein KA